MPFIVYIKGHNSEIAETIWLVIKLGRDIMSHEHYSKISLRSDTNCLSKRADMANLPSFLTIKGRNFKEAEAIWLVIKLG